jgi:hypothetical protein
MKLALFKYFVLLGALCACIYVLLVKNAFTYTMLYSTIGTSVLYLLLSVAYSTSRSKKAEKRKDTFPYFTPGMISKRAIRVGSFAIASFVLFISGSKVMLFGLPLLAMLLSELFDLAINIRNGSYYLYFDGKAIVFHQDNVKHVFASHIAEIEFRYEIFYLTLTNRQVRLIETEKIKEDRREEFIRWFVEWALRNDVNITEEAMHKFKDKGIA